MGINNSGGDSQGLLTPCPWDTHYQFSIKTLLSTVARVYSPPCPWDTHYQFSIKTLLSTELN